MNWCNILINLILCLSYTHAEQEIRKEKFDTWSNAGKAPTRLVELMRSYYEEANQRIAGMNNMRFMYEESPFYEQGYVMHEIIDRYRRLVEHAKTPVKYKSYSVIDTFKRVEFVQKLYFELYHLVRIMHEVPLKWLYTEEFMDKGAKKDAADGGDELENAELNMKRMEEMRAKARKKRKKMYAYEREMYLKGLSKSYTWKKKRAYNKIWPVDYGWEIDHSW
nr:uncharacterized protein LOC126054364 [Helicoverpa armigera]